MRLWAAGTTLGAEDIVTTDDLLRRVRGLVRENYHVEVDADTPLMSSGLIDSLGLESLRCGLEAELGIRIDTRDMTREHWDTPACIVALVESIQRGYRPELMVQPVATRLEEVEPTPIVGGVRKVYFLGPTVPTIHPTARLGRELLLDCRGQITIERDVFFGL